MKKKRMAGLLAGLMLLSSISGALAAEPEAGDAIFVRVSDIGGEYVEVSLMLHAPEGGDQAFQSAGVVLTYNTADLMPVDWSGGEYDLARASGWDSAVQPATKGADALSGKASELYQSGNNGYLYLSAEAIQPMMLPDTALAATTVRFAYAAPPADNAAIQRVLNGVKLTNEDAVAKASFAGSQAIYSDGVTNKLLTRVGITTVVDGTTEGGGSGLTSDFCAVVFYDWDGTLLGSRIVKKGGSLGAGQPAMPNDPTTAPIPPSGELLFDVNKNGNYDFVANNSADNDAKNKEGYTFAGWVDYETGFSTPNVANTASAGQTVQDLVSLDNIQDSLTLKAAYNEDAAKIGGAVNARRYLISYTPFKMEDGVLVTDITVRRPQNARRSLEGEQSLQVALQPLDRGQTIVLIPLGEKDVETIRLSMPGNASTGYHTTEALSFTVLDGENVAKSVAVFVPAADIIAN